MTFGQVFLGASRRAQLFYDVVTELVVFRQMVIQYPNIQVKIVIMAVQR